jgi:hypothetical protein
MLVEDARMGEWGQYTPLTDSMPAPLRMKPDDELQGSEQANKEQMCSNEPSVLGRAIPEA